MRAQSMDRQLIVLQQRACGSFIRKFTRHSHFAFMLRSQQVFGMQAECEDVLRLGLVEI
jgi:hypothetical protein